ncbi:hypothetical protein B0H14DRAFT_3435690 [Mycena olivaceomarginata]|nr:hypothetical protein B0H14DRAFT_3435690 [Mycena olivaceomarginata]
MPVVRQTAGVMHHFDWKFVILPCPKIQELGHSIPAALKERMEREVRGERVLKSMGYTELFNLAFKCGQQAVEKAGGPAKWDSMSQADQSRIYSEARAQLLRDIGQEVFDALNQDEKDDVDLFLWAGCAMHKDMNAFKAAATAMEAFWEPLGSERAGRSCEALRTENFHSVV